MNVGVKIMGKVYVFKVKLKHNKGIWRKIEIKESQTLGHFDAMIREAFSHDTMDHLSAFFEGKAWRTDKIGEIEPFGGGDGQEVKISDLNLQPKNTLEYVYDFGDDLQHIITLEKIIEEKDDVVYPCITGKNKPQYHHCNECEKKGTRVVATWFCLDCSNHEGAPVYLCDDCIDEHDDHYADEIVY